MSDISLKLAKNKEKVMALLFAQQRMLDKWAECPEGSAKKQELWKNLHKAGNELMEALGDDYPIYRNTRHPK